MAPPAGSETLKASLSAACCCLWIFEVYVVLEEEESVIKTGSGAFTVSGNRGRFTDGRREAFEG